MSDQTESTAAAPPKTRIFISYSRRDLEFVDRLDAALRTRGFDPQIDRTEIYAFEDWWKRIQALISHADTVVFVLSPDAVHSEVALREVAYAASQNKRFAPIVVRRVDDQEVPEALRRLNFIFFDDPGRFDDSVTRLAEALVTDIEWVRRHTEFGESASVWESAGRPGPRGLLLRPPVLDEAERWLASRPQGAPLPTPATRAFIEESRRAATQRRNILTGSLGAGLAVALSLAGLAYWQRGVAVEQRGIANEQRQVAEERRQEADRQRTRAEVQRQVADEQRQLAEQERQVAEEQRRLAEERRLQAEAESRRADAEAAEAKRERDRATREEERAKEARDRAQTSLSGLLSERAARFTDQGDTLTAMLMALEAFRPAEFAGADRYEAAAEKSLADALYRYPLRALLRQQGKKYIAAALSPDGRLLAGVREDGDVALFALNGDGSLEATQETPAALTKVRRVIANPKRPMLLVERTDGSYFIWDLAANTMRSGVEGSCGEQSGATFAFDAAGDHLFAHCSSLRIHDLRDGRLTSKPGPYGKFALSGNGARYATYRERKFVEVWETATGRLIKRWTVADSGELAMSHNGEIVYTTFGYYRVRLWNASDGKLLKADVPAQTRTLDLFASPYGPFLVTSGDEGTKVWDDKADAVIQQLSGQVQGFLPNGMLAMGSDEKVTLWDYVVESRIGHTEAKRRSVFHVNGGHRLASASASGSRLASISETGDLYVWGADPPMMLRANDDAGECFRSITVSGDGRTLGAIAAFQAVGGYVPELCAAVSPADGVVLWNSETLTEQHRFNLGDRGRLDSVRLDTAAARILVGYYPKRETVSADKEEGPTAYEVIEAASGRRLFPQVGEPPMALAADISPDGALVAISEGKSVAFWRLSDGSKQKSCALGEADVLDLIFDETGARIALYDKNGDIWLLAPETCVANRIPLYGDQVGETVDLSFRGKLLAVGTVMSGDKRPALRLWDDGEQRTVLARAGDEDEQQGPSDVAVTSNRFLIAETPGENQKVRFVDGASGRTILNFQIDSNDCCTPKLLRFVDGSRRLLSVWQERGRTRVRSWRVLPGVDALKDFARAAVPECLSPATRTQLGLGPEPPRWCIALGKPPYGTPAWKDWLAGRDAGAQLPLPQ